MGGNSPILEGHRCCSGSGYQTVAKSKEEQDTSVGTGGKSRCVPQAPSCRQRLRAEAGVGSEERTFPVSFVYFGNVFMYCREMLPPSMADSPVCPAAPSHFPVLLPERLFPPTPARPWRPGTVMSVEMPCCTFPHLLLGLCDRSMGSAFPQQHALHPFFFLF